jgi:Rrf2 family protein
VSSLQLNQATDYAFRAMLYLAQLPPDAVVKAQVLAEAEVIPMRFLLKILHSLVRAGLVISYRGSEGGFMLAKPATKISLFDVITAMEGPVTIHRCLIEREACNKHCSQECPVHESLHELQDQFVEGLRKITFASLVNRKLMREGERCS